MESMLTTDPVTTGAKAGDFNLWIGQFYTGTVQSDTTLRIDDVAVDTP